MRYIDTQSLKMSADWEARAKEAFDAVSKAADSDRKAVFKQYGDVWSDLKEELRKLSNKKCWYCESIDARSDNAVDHFRPKGNVKGADPPHGGYWWLAFKCENYRFACTYCNSPRSGGGKADNFPLVDENKRARKNTDYIDDEDPLLLDPTNPLDPPLLAFGDDGRAGAAANAGTVDFEKGMRTVKCYNLNQVDLVELRLARIQQVRSWVSEADKQLQRANAGHGVQYRNSATAMIRNIMAALADDQPYSTAVRHFLAGMKAQSSPSAMAVLR